jgi:hypothetical protein
VTTTCVALLAVTFRAAELPAGMGFGEALMVTVGAVGGAAVTVTVSGVLFAGVVPLAPVAVAV